MCLRCGYRGREVQGGTDGRTFVCPRCEADLYARPARSYAEMEGIEEASTGASFERLGEILGALEEPSGDLLRGWKRALLWTCLTGGVAVALVAALLTMGRGPL